MVGALTGRLDVDQYFQEHQQQFYKCGTDATLILRRPTYLDKGTVHLTQNSDTKQPDQREQYDAYTTV